MSPEVHVHACKISIPRKRSHWIGCLWPSTDRLRLNLRARTGVATEIRISLQYPSCMDQTRRKTRIIHRIHRQRYCRYPLLGRLGPLKVSGSLRPPGGCEVCLILFNNLCRSLSTSRKPVYLDFPRFSSQLLLFLSACVCCCDL